MFEKIDPDEDSFETLKQFCLKIGEGQVRPQKLEIHFMYLNHPTVPDALLLVHYNRMQGTIYIREVVEGVDLLPPDNLPLVHDFPVRGRSLLPYAVDVCEDEAIYYYTEPSPDTIPVSMDTIQSLKVPLIVYERFRQLFDEVNPIPWTERQNPDGKLPPPGLPGLPDNVE